MIACGGDFSIDCSSTADYHAALGTIIDTEPVKAPEFTFNGIISKEFDIGDYQQDLIALRPSATATRPEWPSVQAFAAASSSNLERSHRTAGSPSLVA